MGPPPGFSELLNEKYNIQQQEATARGNLLDAQARAIPSTTASENALRGAQAYQTRQTGAQVAPLAQSQIGEASARAGLYGAQGGYYGAETALQQQQHDFNATPIGPLGAGSLYDNHPGLNGQQRQINGDTNTGQFIVPGEKKGVSNVKPGMKGSPAKMPPGKGAQPAAPSADVMQSLMAALGGGGGAPMPQMPGAAPAGPLGMFSGGTVPGQGSGKVDTVPAMLAPHEAVLNRAAADMIGRGKIAAANAKGVQKMGTGGAQPGRGMPLAKKKKTA